MAIGDASRLSRCARSRRSFGCEELNRGTQTAANFVRQLEELGGGVEGGRRGGHRRRGVLATRAASQTAPAA